MPELGQPNHRPPLHVHILFHPDSEQGRKLATRLVDRWVGTPAERGMRIPVFFAPERGDNLPPRIPSLAPPGGASTHDLDRGAVYNLEVVLVDSAMTQRVGSGQGQEWADFLKQRIVDDIADTKLLVVPLALDDSAFDWDDELAQKHFVPLMFDDDPFSAMTFSIAVRAIQLLRDDKPSKDDDSINPNTRGTIPEAPVSVFVSHAKKDLDHKKHRDPVRATQGALDNLPVREWFDARDIRPGNNFDQEIEDGITNADVFLAFLTDEWAGRRWCRVEALLAKKLSCPILIVDALVKGEPRNFPYAGNARTLRWRIPVYPEANDTTWDNKARLEGQQVIAAAVEEALRRLHNKSVVSNHADTDDVVLDTSPEAAHLAHHPAQTSFLYPDPPLGLEELQLLENLAPNASFDTPMRRIICGKSPTKEERKRVNVPIAVSVSESGDLPRYGLVEKHLTAFIDELHLYLLLAGAQIVYGGKLEPEKLDDPLNFTLRLFDLVRGYRDLAEDMGVTKPKPILNAAPWPLWKLYDQDVYKVFGRIAELIQCELPQPLPEDKLQPLENGFVPPVSPFQRYAWSRALTHMREQATQKTSARICIGGRIEGYKGRYAGLIEEPLLSLRAQKPLFLVGTLGGCTRLVIDLLEGRDRPEMTTEAAHNNVEGYDEFSQCFQTYGGDFPSREKIAEDIKRFGEQGPAKALNNGLTDEENRELFEAIAPSQMARLILQGCRKLNLQTPAQSWGPH